MICERCGTQNSTASGRELYKVAATEHGVLCGRCWRLYDMLASKNKRNHRDNGDEIEDDTAETADMFSQHEGGGRTVAETTVPELRESIELYLPLDS